MRVEAAAEVGMSIAHQVRAIRASDGKPTPALSETVDRLMTASGTTTLDALAFAAVARRIFTEVIGMLPEDDEADPVHQPKAMGIVALALLERTLGVLEQTTGYSAEGFTGEADAMN